METLKHLVGTFAKMSKRSLWGLLSVAVRFGCCPAPVVWKGIFVRRACLSMDLVEIVGQTLRKK